jgi:hypothetical protein
LAALKDWQELAWEIYQETALQFCFFKEWQAVHAEAAKNQA